MSTLPLPIFSTHLLETFFHIRTLLILYNYSAFMTEPDFGRTRTEKCPIKNALLKAAICTHPVRVASNPTPDYCILDQEIVTLSIKDECRVGFPVFYYCRTD
jgi:hypothetical protein